jgi:hypothetical protein
MLKQQVWKNNLCVRKWLYYKQTSVFETTDVEILNILVFFRIRRRVGKYTDIEISEELSTIIFRLVQADYYPGGGGSKILRKVHIFKCALCNVSAH